VLDCLSLFIAHSAPSFLSFHPTPVFSFLVPTSKSRHHFSFFCTLSPQVLWNFLCHTPLILPVVSGFFDSFPSFLLACVFVPFTQLYIHPASFCSQSFHFFTGIPVPLIVLFLSLFFSALFFFSIHFVLKLCRSLFRFHSKPIPLAFFPDYVTWCFSAHSKHPSQIFFLHSLYLLMFLPSHPQISARSLIKHLFTSVDRFRGFEAHNPLD
jgi:hypothetical protein